MKCGNCGFEFNEGLFCPECGTKYEDKIVDIPETPIADCVENSDEIDTIEKSEPIGFEEITNVINQEENKPKTQSTMGIVSFILGIVSFLLLGLILIPEIVGIILGIKGKKDKEHKTGLAQAGLVINIIVLAFWVLLYVLLIVLPSSETTNTTTEQVIEENVEVEEPDEVLSESYNVDEDEVSVTSDVQESVEKIEPAAEKNSSKGFDNDTICLMCSYYYLSLYGVDPPFVVVDHEDGNNVTIQLCEDVDEDGYVYNSLAFYTIDRTTLIGYDEITMEEVDLNAFNYENDTIDESTDNYNLDSEYAETNNDCAGYDISGWADINEYDDELLCGNNGYSLWKLKDNVGLYFADGGCVALTTQLDSIDITKDDYYGYDVISDLPSGIFEFVGRVFYINDNTYGIWGFGNNDAKLVATFEFDGIKIKKFSVVDSNNDFGSKYIGEYSPLVKPIHQTRVYIYNKGKKTLMLKTPLGNMRFEPKDRAGSAIEMLQTGKNTIDLYEVKGNKENKVEKIEINITANDLKKDYCFVVDKGTFGGYSVKEVDEFGDSNVDILLNEPLVPRKTPTYSETIQALFDSRISSINDVNGLEIYMNINDVYRAVSCVKGGQISYGNSDNMYDGTYWSVVY